VICFTGLNCEAGFPVDSGWALRYFCACGVTVIGCGVTAGMAKQAVRRRLDDHWGQAAAAGPGWVDW
jgi:hypothetical protein